MKLYKDEPAVTGDYGEKTEWGRDYHSQPFLFRRLYLA